MQSTVSSTLTCETKDWSVVTIETDPCLGVTRRALSDMLNKMKAEVNRLSKSGQQMDNNRHPITEFNVTDVLLCSLLFRTEENREVHR